jgi:tripeptide aminopeptidase
MRSQASSICHIVCAVVTVSLTLQSQEASQSPADLLTDQRIKAALEVAKTSEPQTIDDQIRICEVPAPTFKESARGETIRRAFQQVGLRNVHVDDVGNVLGDLTGTTSRPRLVLSAHLDTVFPDGTDVRVKREGAILRGPGIGDDCRGLAVLLAVARALRQSNIQTPGSITFVATVGEEGLGDLRGVRKLFRVGHPDERRSIAPIPSAGAVSGNRASEIDRFVSIDGTGFGIVNVAVGSIRYRVTFKGPGGHSFSAFGLANPIGAMGRAIAKISDFQASTNPKTTFTVGRVGGGTSVNSIPAEAWMEVDMRSSDSTSLTSLESRFQRAVDAAASEENERWRMPGMVTVVKDRVGYRPAGSTPADSAIVRTAEAVHRVLGLPIMLNESSTDSNIPMSLGIPALTIGGGGRGTNAHALTESFDTSDSWLGTQRVLLLTIALAQR